NAIDCVIKDLDNYMTFLLLGVTGSGKTEVYLNVIDKVLTQNKQVLVLVPEIGLTPQLVTRFNNRYGLNAIGVIHSFLTPKQRQLTWEKALCGNIPIIIGTRSAIFTPLPNLGLIIIDEE